MERDESCAWVCSECLLFFAVSVLDGMVSSHSVVSGEEFASAAPCLPKIAIRAHRSEDRAGMPVSFPEGMVSGRPRSGLSMPVFFIE